MCRLLDERLVLLQHLLKLCMLLHESLVLVACSLLLRLLPLCSRGLQLLQTGRLRRVPRGRDRAGLQVAREI